MKIQGKPIITYLVIALLLVSFVVSCGTPVATSAPGTTSATTPPSAGPKSGGTMRVAIEQAGATPGLDPIVLGSTTYAKALLHAFAESPLTSQGKGLFDVKFAPRLAERWEFTPDGKKLTLYVRKGVKFQNIPPMNGREMTAEDFKFDYDRIKDPKTRSPAAPNFQDMETFSAPDRYTFVINFKNTMPGIFQNLTSATMAIFAPEVVKQDGSLNKTFVGTGPFILKEFSPSVKGVLVKNPDYWVPGQPYLDKVEYIMIPEEAQRKAAFRAGELDVTYEGKAFADDIKNSVPGAKITEAVRYQGVALHYSLNGNPKLWGDKRVRQALQYAIDYDGLIKAVLNGGGTRTGYLAPWYKDWGAKTPDQLPKRDIAKAKALLAEAGYPNGFKTTIMMDSGRMKEWGAPIEPLQAMLKEVGIDAEILPKESGDHVASLRSGQFELACNTAPVGQPGDPNITMMSMYRTAGPQNSGGYSSPKLDQLIAAEQAAFPDTDARKKIYKEILATLEDDLPCIPLYAGWVYQVTQPWVNWPHSVDTQNQNGGNQLREVWIDKK